MADPAFAARLSALRAENGQTARALKPDDLTLQEPKAKEVNVGSPRMSLFTDNLDAFLTYRVSRGRTYER
jgi:hypothetical protein